MITMLVWLFGTSKYVNVLCNVQEIEQSTDILYCSWILYRKKEDHLSSICTANHSHSYSGQVPIIQCYRHIHSPYSTGKVIKHIIGYFWGLSKANKALDLVSYSKWGYSQKWMKNISK